jgi:hypothetical protein
LPQSAPSETGKNPEKSKFYEIGKEGGPAKSSAEIVKRKMGARKMTAPALRLGFTEIVAFPDVTLQMLTGIVAYLL